jgi:hypothetical protein
VSARRSTRIPIELSTTVAVDVSQKQENDRHHDGEENGHGEPFAAQHGILGPSVASITTRPCRGPA